MNESTILLVSSIKLCVVAICAILYAMGGRKKIPKFLRRYIAPSIIGLVLVTQCIVSKLGFIAYLYSVGVVGLLMLGFSLSYGTHSLFMKIVKRLLISCIVCMSGFLLAFYTGLYWLAALQAIVTISTHLILGTTNPVQAVKEEMLIGVASILFLPFYL